MKNLRILLSVILAGTLLTIVSAERRQPSRQAREKARYYYFEGVKAMNTDSAYDVAYELNKRAYQADPTYPEGASAYGLSRLLNQLDTFQSPEEMRKGLALMRQLVDADSTDYYNLENYAYIATLADSAEEAERVLKMDYRVNPQRTNALMSLAQVYYGNGEFTKAIEAVDAYQEAEGEDPDLVVTTIMMRAASGDSIGAFGKINDLMSRHPDEMRFAIIKGQLYESLGKPDSALYYYRVAERMDTSSSAPKLAMASVYKDQKDSVNYDAVIYQALLSKDLEMEQKTGLMAEYLQNLMDNRSDTTRGDYLFGVLSSQYPHEADVQDLSARYNAAKGNFAKALEQIDLALDQNRSNGNYWGQKMTYLISSDRFADAARTYDEAKKYVPATLGLKSLYATALSLEKEYPKAREVYVDLIRDMDSTINVADTIQTSQLEKFSYEGLKMLSSYLTSIGDLYWQQGDDKEAYRCYDNALRAFPGNSLALNNYAYYLAEHGGDLDKAYEMIKKCIELDDENPTFLDTYAWILFRRQDYKKALEYQQAAIEKSEKANSLSSELYSHYGDILFMNGKPDEALAAWKKALEVGRADKDNPIGEKEEKLLKKKIEHRTFFFE